MDDPVEGLAPEPSSLSSLQLDLAQPKSGVEEVLDEAATARAQARHMTLSTDAEGALNMLKHLEALPNLKSYDALRAGLYGAKVGPQPISACWIWCDLQAAFKLTICPVLCRGWRSLRSRAGAWGWPTCRAQVMLPQLSWR